MFKKKDFLCSVFYSNSVKLVQDESKFDLLANKALNVSFDFVT